MTRHHRMIEEIPPVTQEDCDQKREELIEKMYAKHDSRLVSIILHELDGLVERLARLQLSRLVVATSLLVSTTKILSNWAAKNDMTKVSEHYLLSELISVTLEYISILELQEIATKQDYVDAEIESPWAVKH